MQALKIINCNTLSSFMKVLDMHNSLWCKRSKYDWAFRGQADSDWLLVSSAFRPDALYANQDYFRTYDIQSKMIEEYSLIYDFLTFGDRFGLPVPGDGYAYRTPEGFKNHLSDFIVGDSMVGKSFPPAEMLETWAIAQHHGIPTRLIDFTHNIKIAAFFAAERAINNKPQNYSWVTNSKKEKQVLHNKYRRQVKSWEKKRLAVWAVDLDFVFSMWEGDDPELCVLTVPYTKNKFIYSQEGFFIYDRKFNSVWEEFMKNKSANQSIKDYLDQSLKEETYPCLGKKIRDTILMLNENKKEFNEEVPDLNPNPLIKITLPYKYSGELYQVLDREGINRLALMPSYDNVSQYVRAKR